MVGNLVVITFVVLSDGVGCIIFKVLFVVIVVIFKVLFVLIDVIFKVLFVVTVVVVGSVIVGVPVALHVTLRSLHGTLRSLHCKPS